VTISVAQNKQDVSIQSVVLIAYDGTKIVTGMTLDGSDTYELYKCQNDNVSIKIADTAF